MHPDIEKLINIAKESGDLNEKQKEIILRKAGTLGEDIDEVEMIIETFKVRSSTNLELSLVEKRKQCPNCGAVISETVFQCPECGYILQKENKASEDARKLMDGLQEALFKAAEPLNKTEQWVNPFAPAERQANVIKTFTMPVTKEGLTQMLEFSFSNYISADSSNWASEQIKQAWYGRCVQAYNALQRIAIDDNSVKNLLEQYSFSLKKEHKKLSSRKKTILWLIVLFVVIIAFCFFMGRLE